MMCSSSRLAAFLGVLAFLLELQGGIAVSTTLPTSAAETTVDGTSTSELISETSSSVSPLDPFTSLDPFTGSSYSFESTSDVSIGSSDGASPFTSYSASVASLSGETNGLDSTMTSTTTPAPTTTVYTGPTTTRTTTTTTINPVDYVRCGAGNYVDVGINVDMIIMDVGVIQFACLDGFKETAEGATLITCNQRTKRWDHEKALVCEPVEPPYEPPEEPEGPPAWIPVLVIMLLVLLILAIVGMVLLAVYACRRKPIQKSTTIVIREAQEAPPPPPPATPPPTPPKKEKTQTKWWWPWKPSPPKPPSGHIGMDGIALEQDGSECCSSREKETVVG